MSDAEVPMNRMRAGDRERDQALTALQRSYEEGRLDLEEMHERQEKALKAKFADELPPLFADLPEGQDLATPGATTPVQARREYPVVAPADAYAAPPSEATARRSSTDDRRNSFRRRKYHGRGTQEDRRPVAPRVT